MPEEQDHLSGLISIPCFCVQINLALMTHCYYNPSSAMLLTTFCQAALLTGLAYKEHKVPTNIVIECSSTQAPQPRQGSGPLWGKR